MQPLGALRKALWRRRHSALLTAIIVTFAVRPVVGDAPGVDMLFSLAMMLLLAVAMYSMDVNDLIGEPTKLAAERRRQTIVGWVLAIVALGERIMVLVAPSPRLMLLSTIAWLLFFAYVSAAKLSNLVRQKVVTGEAISLAVAVYLLLGMTWGLLYMLIFQRHPDAFHFERQPDALHATHNDFIALLPVFVYFSLTTLATIGYGDITPVTLSARYAAVAQGIAGQFYLAILVARLVALQITRRE
ncbi:MAG: potassium channel family protein [Deltaproteobacteria bacterium]|nr:potassium channel family protein [Deltaproteobacteria bacterium]